MGMMMAAIFTAEGPEGCDIEASLGEGDATTASVELEASENEVVEGEDMDATTPAPEQLQLRPWYQQQSPLRGASGLPKPPAEPSA